jgi:F-type H+-transporting ATPase subunit a
VKNATCPPDLPAGLYLIITPLEFFSVFLLRPFTHAVRLFATMFAGHLLVTLAATIGYHFLVETLTPLGVPLGMLGILLTIVVTAFELFIQALQAYVFTLLTAFFIDSALRPTH